MRDKRTPKDVCGEASIASVSARVRRDIWDEIFFFCSRSHNQSITRLETLATQAMAQRTLQLTRVGRIKMEVNGLYLRSQRILKER